MRVLVVDPAAESRAELIHLICELPGVDVRGAVPGLLECHVALAAEPFEVIVAGELPLWELASIVSVAETLGCAVVERTTDAGLVATLSTIAARRTEAAEELLRLATRSKVLAFERDAQVAGPRALALHLQTGEPDRARRSDQTIDLRAWLPLIVTQLRGLVPDYIEVVPMVAADTHPVRCVPSVLEQVVLELVLRAAAQLPWGGTVWITATPGADDEVKLDVLENGHGHVLDLVLRASAPTPS